MDTDGYISVKELADKYRLTEQAIYKIIDRDKQMPVHKIGGTWRFKIGEIDDYFKNRGDRRVNNEK